LCLLQAVKSTAIIRRGEHGRVAGKSAGAGTHAAEPCREPHHSNGGGHPGGARRKVAYGRKFSPDRSAVDPGAAVLLYLRRLGPGAGNWRLPAIGQVSLLSADHG